MTLTVLNVAYPFAPVGPDAVGGAEQILSLLDNALVRAGHRSLVLACEGSVVAGELLATPRPEGTLTDVVRKAIQERHRVLLEDALRRHRVDLVHMHGIDFADYLPPPGLPTLVTLHLPPGWYPPEAFRVERPLTFLHCVSHAQEAACPAETPLLPVIENGVPTDQLIPRGRKREFALALGRICREKGFHLALDAAALADVPLLLAGEVFPYEDHERYFQDEIRPRLDASRRFVGPIGLRRKRRLLASARCLLIPSLAPETSSLVAMEALACGTPVIAFPSGALPEIVEHGRTGFLAQDEREMAEAIASVQTIDPRVCREAAEARFSASQMCEQYLRRYRELIGAHRGSRRLRGRSGLSMEPPRLRVEELSTLPSLEALRPEWSRLCDESLAASPFQSPEWLIAWRRQFDGGRLWTLAVYEGERLVALAPMFIYPEQGQRKLLLLGAGITDRLDVLVAPGYGTTALRAILDHIAQHAELWDICEFVDLPQDSSLLSPNLPAELRGRTALGNVCPVLRLPDDVTGLEGCIPASQMKKLRYYRRRISRIGSTMIETAEPENFDELFAALLQLHQARWAPRDLPGVLAEPSVREFHREAAWGLLRRGRIRLYGLRLDGRIIASFYGFRDAERTYYYLGGFDPQFKSLSPGLLIVGHAIEQAVRDESRAFDFLRGQESYKYEWGAKDQFNSRRILWAERSESAGQAGESVPCFAELAPLAREE